MLRAATKGDATETAWTVASAPAVAWVGIASLGRDEPEHRDELVGT
jgi:hypothetical protein